VLPGCLLLMESTCGSAANSTRAAPWDLFHQQILLLRQEVLLQSVPWSLLYVLSH